MRKYLLPVLFSLFLSVAHGQVPAMNSLPLTAAPAWLPEGYPTTRYYFMPALKMYYDAHKANFIYRENNRWTFSKKIPGNYNEQDLTRATKVMLAYRGLFPHRYFQLHQKYFPKG